MKNIFLAAGILGWALAATGCNKNDNNMGTAPTTPDMTNAVQATNMPPTTNTDLINTNLSSNPMTNRPPQ